MMTDKWGYIIEGFALGMCITNTLHVLTYYIQREYKKCHRCKHKYKYSRTTSNYKNMFCSLECEYFDMVDDLKSKTNSSYEDVCSYLAKDPRYVKFQVLPGEQIN